MLAKITLILLNSVVLSALGLFAWWSWLQPTDYITDMKYTLIRNSYVSGDKMIINRYHCIKRDIPPNSFFSRAFVNNEIHILPNSNAARLKPVCEERSFFVDIPIGLGPGLYTYRVALIIEANPIKTVKIDLPDVKVYISNDRSK